MIGEVAVAEEEVLYNSSGVPIRPPRGEEVAGAATTLGSAPLRVYLLAVTVAAGWWGWAMRSLVVRWRGMGVSEAWGAVNPPGAPPA